MRKRDLIRDTKKNCLKRGIDYKAPTININEFITISNKETLPKKYDETAKEVHAYKVAL